MIVYKLSDEGRAFNVRAVLQSYVPAPDEILLQVAIMPDIYTLHTQEYKDYLIALDTEKQAIADAIATKLPSLAKINTKINKLPLDEATKAFLADLTEVLYHHIKGTTNGG